MRDDLPASPEALERETAVERTGGEDRTSALIRTSCRLGVWGVVGGFVPIIAFTLGAPISLPVSITLMAAGFVASGIGTTVGAVLVHRRSPPQARLLRAASFLAAPVGLALASIGVATLLGWEVVGAAGGIAVSVAGVAVVVLLVAAFLSSWVKGDEDRDSASAAIEPMVSVERSDPREGEGEDA